MEGLRDFKSLHLMALYGLGSYHSYCLWCANCHILVPLSGRSSQWSGIHNKLDYVAIGYCRYPPLHFSHAKSDQPHGDISWN